LYLINDTVELLTHDHFSVNDYAYPIDSNAGDAHYPATRAMISQALGLSESIKVDTLTKPLAPGTRLFLCSDGLNYALENENMLSSIQQIALRQPNLNRACEMILTLARNHDTESEISMILVKAAN